MKQLFYEIKKVFGQRFFVLIAAALLVICTVLGIFSMRESTSALRNEKLAEAYRLYNEDPDAARALYDEYAAMSKAGINVPDAYSYLRSAIRAADSNASYPEKLMKISESARKKALEFEREGYGEGEFIYDYQKNCEDLYRIASNTVELPTAIVSGWSNYFSQDYITYFILAAVFLLVCTVYIPEKTDGIYPLLRSTKRGRYAISGAKLGAVVLLSAVINAVFSGASFAAIAVKIGFSSPDMPLQVLSAFEYCPYLITVGDYFAIHSALRLAGVLIFALLCSALTVVRCDYVISFSGAALLILGNFLLNTVSYNSVNNPAKHLNLFSLCDSRGVFSRYYAVDLFGSLVPFLTFGLYLLIPLSIAAAVWAYLAIARGRGHLNSAGILSQVVKRFKLPVLKGRKKASKVPLRRCGLASFEVYKIFGKLGTAMLLILLVIIRVNFAMDLYAYPTEADEIFYREYLEYLDGEYTEEKAQYIRDEIKFINTAIQKYEKQLEKGTEELPSEELKELIDDANYAYAHKKAAERASDYSNKLRSLIELGKNDAIFLYETGWQLLLGREADLLAFAIMLLAVCNIFGIEFGKSSSSGRFADILRATKNGRRYTFFSKLTAAVVTALAVFLIFETLDLYLILKNYTLPHHESASVILFERMQNEGIVRFDGVSFTLFAAAGTLLRLLATLFFAIGVFALSALVKKNISVMLISALAILLPSAMSNNSGLTFLSRIDFLPIAAGAELIKLSEAAKPGSPFSTPITSAIILFGAAVLVIAAAHDLWCNPYHKTRSLKT